MGDARSAGDVDFANRAFLLVALTFGVAASIAALRDGPWLDEFWSFHLGDARVPLSESLSRWLVDPHPLPINALYRLVIAAGAGSPAAARLALNLPALIALAAATLFFARRARESRTFYPMIAVLLLGQFRAVGDFADFRSYFIQLAVIGVAVQYLHFLIEEDPDERAPHFSGGDAIGLAAIILSLSLHFVTALLMSPVCALALAWLVSRGRKAAPWRLGATLTLTWVVGAALAFLQLRQLSAQMDVSWLNISTSDGLRIYADLGARTLASNPSIPAAAAMVAFRSRLLALREPFPIILLAGAAIGGLALLGINALKPVILGRYVIALAVFALAGMATIVSRSRQDGRWLLSSISAAAMLMIFLQSSREAKPNWEAGLAEVSRLAGACPGARIQAAGPWRFTDNRASATARRETAVLARGLRYLAGTRGLSVEMLDDVTPAALLPGSGCPAILWVEHFHPEDGVSPQALLGMGLLTVRQRAEVAIFRTQTGAVFVIKPPPEEPALRRLGEVSPAGSRPR